MSEFRNPYHFVPLGNHPPGAALPLADFDLKNGGDSFFAHVTHASFTEGAVSGRITCRVTVETPLICANRQEERNGWTKKLIPFELEKGKPALPASALRGMISSLAEAASGSALRVLTNRNMSFRRNVSEGLSALGMIVEKNGSLFLLPLASPHFDQQDKCDLPRDGNSNYAEMFPVRKPKIYFGTQHSISTPVFLARYKTNSSPLGGPFFAVHRDWLSEKVKNNRFWLGQYITGELLLWDDLKEAEKASGQWIRGILRVLGKFRERAENLPTKKHEFFLPFSPDDEAALATGHAALFPVDPEAILRFNQLADERAEAENEEARPVELLPFSPNGSPRGTPGEKRPPTSWQLKAGDIVFFRPSSCGKKIVEVSLSSAWRGRVEESAPELSANAPLYRFFGPDHSPLVRRRDHQGRDKLTLAEQLFGVVEILDSKRKKTPDEKQAFALASRLRFSHAHLAPSPAPAYYQDQSELLSPEHAKARKKLGLADIPLKNLASPKPPSPALYFQPRNGAAAYVSKKKLNPREHAPQGRKFYLRRDPETYDPAKEAFIHPDRLNDEKERASIARQHQSVEKFVPKGATFVFHIDFENLSELELQLLVYSLSPYGRFRHQIGHGKPLGLGQIHLEIENLRKIHRRRRYSLDALGDSRWNGCDFENAPRVDFEQKIDELRTGYREWAAANGLGAVLAAIELLGAPSGDGVPIHYPQVHAYEKNRQPVKVEPGSAEFESEHYRWFVQNDDGSRGRTSGQFLAPLAQQAGRGVAASLPKLDTEQKLAPPRTSYRPAALAPKTGAPVESKPKAEDSRPVVGQAYPARVGKVLNDDRIRFLVRAGGKDWEGFLDIRKADRATWKERIPETWTGNLVVKGVNGDLLQLEPPKGD